MKTPKLKSPGVNLTLGKEAPGLKFRERDILHKALGISPSVQLHPVMVQKLLTHPDPKVQAAAKQAILSKGFKLGA